jgi:hypothetical protein
MDKSDGMHFKSEFTHKLGLTPNLITGRSLHFGGPMRAKIWRPLPFPINGGRQLCRLKFAKRVSVTQISDHINKQKHLSEIGESVAD